MVPQIVQAVQAPVIAAGGIADARGVVAALALGAAGVQVGTAYLLCPEVTISTIHRNALKSEAAGHTALTNLFMGRPVRGIVNRIMRSLGQSAARHRPFRWQPQPLLPCAKAESQGSGTFRRYGQGNIPRGCKEIPAAQLTRELASGVLER